MSSILAHLDFLDEAIDRLSDAIEEQLVPFAPAVELLRTIPGIQARTAQVIVAEIGIDMSVFPTQSTLRRGPASAPATTAPPVSDAPDAPATDRAGSGIALTEAALAATHTKNTYLTAQYQRLRPRRGHKRALGASSTRYSHRSGTCSAQASSIPIPAATTSSAATPPARSNASSPSSNDSVSTPR